MEERKILTDFGHQLLPHPRSHCCLLGPCFLLIACDIAIAGGSLGGAQATQQWRRQRQIGSRVGDFRAILGMTDGQNQ